MESTFYGQFRQWPRTLANLKAGKDGDSYGDLIYAAKSLREVPSAEGITSPLYSGQSGVSCP